MEYATLTYNVAEAVVSLLAGSSSGSVSLIAFGVDSVIEVSSGSIMLWRLGRSSASAERRAQQWIAVSFFALAIWVLGQAIQSLLAREGPETSWPGIVLASVSLLVMPMLARAKRQVGRAINSAAMVADSKQTELCAYLSAILLAGLALHAVFGWWWADAVAGLIMTPIILNEGRNAWQGKGCCDACH